MTQIFANIWPKILVKSFWVLICVTHTLLRVTLDKYYKVGNDDYDNGVSFRTILNQYESEKENGEEDMSSIQTDDPGL